MMDRRRFLRAAALLGLLPLVPPGALRGARGRVVVGLVTPAGDGAAAVRRGAALAGAEAAQAAQLLGREFALLSAEVDDAAAVAQALDDHSAAGCGIVVSGFEGETATRELSAAAEARGVLLLNAACRSDALRGIGCSPRMLHVEASETMYRNALRIGAAQAGLDPAQLEAVPWHAALSRFGAGQLNDRYRVRFGEEIAPAAWPAWMAVKAAWEGAARTRSADPDAIAAFLLSRRGFLDGHKGTRLSFRDSDRQLRQPLYVRRADEIVAEVPRGLPGEGVTVELLDELVGDQHAAAGCGGGPR
jgi:ABC-type branched-subunit amino acid transport system substrate-binding protein